jgi:hypothetical protein
MIPTPDAAAESNGTAGAPADHQQLTAARRRESLRRSATRFHGRLARTRLLVAAEAGTEVRLDGVDRRIDGAMVAVELLIAILSGRAVPATLFAGDLPGQPPDDPTVVPTTRPDGDRRWDAWEHLWVLRGSASQFGGRLNGALAASEAYGLSRPQARVGVAAVMAVVRLVEDIGRLPVPPDLLELVS